MNLGEAIQKAIDTTAAILPAVSSKAFQRDAGGTWHPQKDCLTSYYSSGEKILCAILLCFWIEANGGVPDWVTMPQDMKSYPTDHLWPGAYELYEATGTLTNLDAWKAISLLLVAEA